MRFAQCLVVAVICFFASAAFANVSDIQVTVAREGGAVVGKAKLDAGGSFSTGTLQPGAYTILFQAKPTAALKGGQFSLRVRAGKQRVDASGVAGEKFVAGGVGMRLQVKEAAKMSGDVTSGLFAAERSTSASGAKEKVVNGKRYIWVRPETGSNMGGRWVPEEEANAPSKVNRGGRDQLRDMQDRSNG